jgi:serine O-acetyltransferase
MGRFRELYNADLARYGGNAEFYIRVFHFLHRKASETTIYPIRLFYKVLFRLWANRRGLEITANENIGGGIYIGHAYNITINGKAKLGRNCNIHKGVVIGQVN